MKGAWSKLREVEQRIATIAETIRTAPKDRLHRHGTDPTAAVSRELTAIMVQPVAMALPMGATPATPDLSERRATFYNGDVSELVIERLFAYVGGEGTSGQDLTLPWWGRTADGFCPIDFSFVEGTDLTYPLALIDFLWTYEVSSRASQYGRADFVSSDSLMGMGDRGAGLEFRVPLRIPRGEKITFKVQPLFADFRRIAGRFNLGLSSVNIVFVGLGHRRG